MISPTDPTGPALGQAPPLLDPILARFVPSKSCQPCVPQRRGYGGEEAWRDEIENVMRKLYILQMVMLFE